MAASSPETRGCLRFAETGRKPKKYRYEDSLAPALEWDGQNPARERGEAHLAAAEANLQKAQQALAAADSQELTPQALAQLKQAVSSAQEAVRQLKAMSKPFLNWAGKAERLSFEALPLFPPRRFWEH